MSRLTELLAELADEEDLEPEELAEVMQALRRRRKKAPLARQEKRTEIDFPTGPTRLAPTRGEDMYGAESAQDAEERWREQEMRDSEGAYGPGGMTAGGIFGGGTVTMDDYDPAAHRRTEERVAGMSNVRLVQVLEKLLDRVGALESPDQNPQLRGGNRRRLGRGGHRG